MEHPPFSKAADGAANGWTRGRDSTIYRFESRNDGETDSVAEFEVFDIGGVEARLRKPVEGAPDEWETGDSQEFESLTKALDYARKNWGLNDEALPDSPPVRVQRLVLSELADFVGSLAVFGHDVPAEKRDALAAAYEALDEPGLPITFYDCPDDGAALDPLPDDPDLPEQIEVLRCRQCENVYHLDRDTGELEIES